MPPDPSPTPTARVGLFSTLTGTGSRDLVRQIAAACASGALGGVSVAFLFVNREAGEFEATDASVAELGAAFDWPILRASAIRFRGEMRKAARAAAEAGDEEPLWAWREAFYASYRDRLPATDMDFLIGDMWIWGPRSCAERRGVNLHPSLPSGPLGKMWFEVIWDLVADGARDSGVMLHRVTPLVDRGPVVSWCRYPLRGPGMDPLWAALPADPAARAALVDRERALKRETRHPLFQALRATGLARELPLMLETIRALADGRLRLGQGAVLGAEGRALEGGLDLSAAVEAAVGARPR